MTEISGLRAGLMSAAERSTGPRRHAELDWLMLAVTFLCCLGLVMAVSVQAAEPDVSAAEAMRGQGGRLLGGVIALLVAAILPLGLLRAKVAWFYGACVALVFYAAFLGPTWNHAQRWISIAGHSFQPVEPARLAMILMTAAAIAAAKARERLGQRQGLLALGLILGPAFALSTGLFLQPDKGNALLIMMLGGAMVLASGLGLRWLMLVGAALVPVLWVVVNQDSYSQGRIERWASGTHPYQVRESISALRLGSLWGEGIGAGWRKVAFVPEAQNDFVFAIVGEELGFLGSLLVVASFTLIGIAGCRLTLRLVDPFHRYVVLGCTLALCAQALVNLLVTTGLGPAKGIDLPFVSSGGTNLMASLAAVGLIGNAVRADAAGAAVRADGTGRHGAEVGA